MAKVKIVNADVIEWAKNYKGPKFHALFCDAPYELAFMNKSWDSSGISFNPDTWRALAEHLLPGAFLFVFAGTLNDDLISVAMRQAGLRKFHKALVWGTGSGFPKSTKINLSSSNFSKQFCQCDDSRQQSVLRGYQRNAQNGKGKVLNSQSDCQEFFRSDDEQLLPLIMNGQHALPSQVDVPEHNHSGEPLAEIHADTEPYDNPYSAQYKNRRARRDFSRQRKIRRVSQRSQKSRDETYRDYDSKSASARGNKSASSQSSKILVSDTSAYDKHDIYNSDYKKHSGSLDKPFNRIHIQDTKNNVKCQVCGKLKNIFSGHRYGLQSLKPSAETILIFQNPYDGKPVDSIVENGAGALWIDGARISTSSRPLRKKLSDLPSNGIYGDGLNGSRAIGETSQGRWPANLILQHSKNDNGACSPECPCRELDEQSGDLSRNENAINKIYKTRARTELSKAYNSGINENPITDYGDTGGASRYFFQADWNHEAAEKIEQAAAVRYCAKSSRRERDAGLNHLPLKQKYTHNGKGRSHEIFTAESANDNKWAKKNPCYPMRNNHPCVKPISFCKYICKLLAPPIEYAPRRILIPFAGVMSEAIGAMLAGWEEIVAIEKEKEYCDIGKARVKYWQTHKEPIAKKSKPTKPVEREVIESAELFPELA